MLMRGSNSWKKVIKNVLAEHTINCQEGQLQGGFYAENSVNLWNNGIFVTEFGYPKVSLKKPWIKAGEKCSKSHGRKRKRCRRNPGNPGNPGAQY